MGKRGPQPGWKQAKAAAEAKAAAAAPANKRKRGARKPPRAATAPVPGSLAPAQLDAPLACATDAAENIHLSYSERNNPRYLSGAELRAFGHKKGMAHSTMEHMADDKLREQLRYIEAHRLETEA